MPKTLPIIRAAALAPMIRWMEANRRPVEDRLQAVDLAYLMHEEPNQPLPLINAAKFLRNATREEGADIAFRVVSAISLRDLAMIGDVALGARTPDKALERIIALLPYHCTHENITTTTIGNELRICESWQLQFDGETLHVIHQFFTAIMRSLVLLTGQKDPVFNRILMVPHPKAGLDHLRPYFGDILQSSEDQQLEIFISQTVAKCPFRIATKRRLSARSPTNLPNLRGDGTLKASVEIVAAEMMSDGLPTVQRLSTAAGMSVRSFQRRLRHENTSVSRILDKIRRREALQALSSTDVSMADLATKLGYAKPSALTRAVYRWTGMSPQKLRSLSLDRNRGAPTLISNDRGV